MQTPSVSEALERILDHFRSENQGLAEPRVRLATPLGLGKPNTLLNALYRRVKDEKPFSLDIYTALSLDVPQPSSDMEARFLRPFVQRLWGDDYPRLAYLVDLADEGLPPHINLHEFYVSAGAFKDNAYVQQHYRSINYTHVAQNLTETGIDLIVQLIAKSRSGDGYSLSVNTDLTLDLMDRLQERDRRPFVVGVVHEDLPFLGGDAVVDATFFDLILDGPESQHTLFPVPREALSEVDAAIGLHASALVEDGGTLQIGIGSLSDSVVRSLIVRHQDNSLYRKVLQGFQPSLEGLCHSTFQEGLYGMSELVMDGFMHLRKAGILKRMIHDQGRAVYLHGAFALGSQDFYKWLGGLEGEDDSGFSMTRVSKVNDLYDVDEKSLRRQRKKARFFNTAMQVSLLGAAASETLPDGMIISGVGGQYNFVAMAHELAGAASVILLRSTSVREGKRVSNIVWSHGNLTIPRHLRDIVVTEYGVAQVRGQSDSDVIKAILNITDSAFQDELLATAKQFKKVHPSYQIPDYARRNTPENLKRQIRQHPGFYELFPFGSDFDEQELRILQSLKGLKGLSAVGKVKAFLGGMAVAAEDHRGDLERMDFGMKGSWREQVAKRILLHQFNQNSSKVKKFLQ